MWQLLDAVRDTRLTVVFAVKPSNLRTNLAFCVQRDSMRRALVAAARATLAPFT